MTHAIFVFGPAGTGKSTFTQNLYEHGKMTGRSFTPINLDPSQSTNYPFSITNYITVPDLMEELDIGPNGGLIEALTQFLENIDEIEELQDLSSDYLIIDCPGQIELFTHSDVMVNIVKFFQKTNSCCVLYLIDGQYMMDVGKYISACVCGLVCMMRFNVPHLNIVTKMDLLDDEAFETHFRNYRKEDVFMYPDERLAEYLEDVKGKYKVFCEKMVAFVSDNSMLTFMPLNWEKEGMIDDILYQIDMSIGYYEDLEPREGIR